ncbi:MAG: hypothetical protein PHI79_05790 [Sulfurovaceae bacterium]|nr:hypothetical protein [Sulfurovaceae bacterium]MDD5549089.1 hypothetical protein [Sulfurovaceae bacterium]
MAKQDYDFIVTSTGRKFYMKDIEKNQLHIEDIAIALSRICRFAGHCKRYYSVAEHSILVANLLPPEFALAGLLHDATEAYLGDVTRPLKNQLQQYRDIEDRLHGHIEKSFDVDFSNPIIKEADDLALFIEASHLYPNEDLKTWGIKIPNDIPEIMFITDFDINPFDAKKMFIKKYLELTS